ncbi:DUF3047 domain-containing protein [Zobellella maritima]|uniref:DUF3047 domain-containing protein n=1 Tax=Zobellella maritima TaxID=2059725 RepID=UPI000E30572B|nr:DUF3047 domain-containing protein [Zobellella maritima]
MYKLLLHGLLLALLATSARADMRFSPETMLAWEPESFVSHTDYSLVFDRQLQRKVLRAASTGSASGLFHEQKIDLDSTPWLSWMWRVEQFPDVANEQEKAGDDFAVRVYIVVRDGWTFLSTRAISYVWSQQVTASQSWPNPFTGDKAMMLALRNRTADSGWMSEKRNLKADLKQFFGKDFRYIEAVAIMTDADNSNSRAIGYYADIAFTRE